MLYFILIALVLIAGIGIIMLILSRSEIRHMTRNLKEINEQKTSALVRLSSPNRQLEALAVEINRSIAERQEAEAQYRRMDRSRRQNIANISHDLRTPLTSVLGYIQLLDDEMLSDEERARYKAIVQGRAKDLNRLITGFFDLSRLEAGEYGFELKSISLPNILCEMMASFYPDFTARGIEPAVDIDQAAPSVIADENAVRRVFSNLIQNALKYSSGTIHVSLKRENDMIVTRFANDAPLLMEDDARHLFDRFYTAERMRSGQNTGLGLAITRQLVEKMNGEIGASVNSGKLVIQIRWKLQT